MRKVIVTLFVVVLTASAAFANPPSRTAGDRSKVVRSNSRNDREFDPIERFRQLVRRIVNIHITPTDEMPTPPHP